MKYAIVMMLACIVVTLSAPAQFKSELENQPSVSQYLVHPSTGMSGLLSWFNPDNFQMRQSASMSYFTFGGQGMSMASYTNSMFYKIADPLNVRFDLTLQGSPFGQYGSFQQNDLNKLFLSNAELNYQPWQNFLVRLQYTRLPLGYYGWYGRSPYSSLPGEY